MGPPLRHYLVNVFTQKRSYALQHMRQQNTGEQILKYPFSAFDCFEVPKKTILASGQELPRLGQNSGFWLV